MSAFPTAAAATASAAATAAAAATKSARTLLILDLNGCLMTRLNHQEFQLARKSGYPLPAKVGTVAKKPVFMRPHAIEFVRYVQAMPELDVAVWTSATAKNAATLIDMVLGSKTYSQFKFVWGREKCTPVQNEETPWATIKVDLGAIYKAFPDYTPERTLIVDDSLYKARLNAANALVLPSFDLINPLAAPMADTVLLDLAAYLRLLVRVNPPDVRKYIHANPFSI
ncbi:HAD-like domain-containing protein, partial [Catenaria anguillulae PL171]